MRSKEIELLCVSVRNGKGLALWPYPIIPCTKPTLKNKKTLLRLSIGSFELNLSIILESPTIDIVRPKKIVIETLSMTWIGSLTRRDNMYLKNDIDRFIL